MNLFIAIHALALFLWGLPESTFASRVLQPVRPYIMYTGLWHIWNMFGPTLCEVQMDLRAEVKHKDGSVSHWTCPRMQELSISQRVIQGRWRKWRELNFHGSFAGAWNATAKFVARRMNHDPRNPPLQVSLVRYWEPTPAIKPKLDYQPPLRAKDVKFSRSYTYAVFPIKTDDL